MINLCTNGGLTFNFGQHGVSGSVTTHGSNMSCRNEFTAMSGLHISNDLPCNFRVNSLRNIMKSAAKANFQSHSLFNNS